MSPELQIHTDDEDIRMLCEQYWKMSDSKTFTFKLSELLEQYGVSAVALRKLVNTNSTAHLSKFSCIECGEPRPFTSRTDFLNSSRYYSRTPWVCSTCADIQLQEKQREQEREDQLRQEVVDAEYQRKRDYGVSVVDMCFADAIYLLGVIRTGACEDLSYIMPHEHYDIPLSPHADFDLEILRQLYHAGILCVHPGSKGQAVKVKSEVPETFSFYPLQVHWLLSLPESERATDLVAELENMLQKGNWPDAWASQVQELRTRVALEESLQYLQYVLSDHGFDLTVGKKTTQVLQSLLRKFSVAQICNFSWRAAKEAASFYMRKDVSKKHAVNIVSGVIQRMADRAIAEGWETKPFGRNYDLPQCMISQVLYNTVLQIGDDGFEQALLEE
jgi:hypothetical protein